MSDSSQCRAGHSRRHCCRGRYGRHRDVWVLSEQLGGRTDIAERK